MHFLKLPVEVNSRRGKTTGAELNGEHCNKSIVFEQCMMRRL